MVHTDVFVGALGSGFANVVYMLPGSVAISYSPPHVGGFFFDTLSEMAGIHYIPVFNSSTPFPPECHKRINANGESTIRACLDVLYANNIYMDVEQLAYLLDTAIIHLRSEKYRVMWKWCTIWERLFVGDELLIVMGYAFEFINSIGG